MIGDFADDTNFTRKGQLLNQFYIRGRHYVISTVTSTQVYKQISPTVRKSMTHLLIDKLRNYGNLESIIEEMSAIFDKKTLLQIYHEAVSESYAFLYINIMQRDRSEMLMKNFTQYLKTS